MDFHNSMSIMAALANSPCGLNASGIVNRVGAYGCKLSKRQVERLLKHLELDKYVLHEKVKYRANIDIKLYHMTAAAWSLFDAIATEYEVSEKQLELPGKELE